MKQELYKKLEQYDKEGIYPFHMPGHKRNHAFAPHEGSGFSMDITEIDGFDNLHHPEGVLKEAQERAARLYQVKESFFSVGGSSAALLAAICASCRRGGKLLMARNCHKAVYHGAYLWELQTSYLYPEVEPDYGLNGGITPEAVRKALRQEPDIQAVVITSPTYDGVVSDIPGIARAAHEAGCILIVDEAHGAHLKFHSCFPDSAISGGADLVIQSLHKTMPSMTQTALLHRNSDRVSHEKLQRFMGIYQSSSPSYVLMASMDACICKMFTDGAKLFDAFAARLMKARKELEGLSHIRLVGNEIVGEHGIFGYDLSKMVFSLKNCPINGRQLSRRLREEYRLEMEMEAMDYVLALTSVCDREEGFERLVAAMKEIDASLDGKQFYLRRKAISSDNIKPMEQVMSITRAMEGTRYRYALFMSKEKISGEFVYLYPPGIPLLVPGEWITSQCVETIFACRDAGFSIQGLSDYSGQSICIVEESSIG